MRPLHTSQAGFSISRPTTRFFRNPAGKITPKCLTVRRASRYSSMKAHTRLVFSLFGAKSGMISSRVVSDLNAMSLEPHVKLGGPKPPEAKDRPTWAHSIQLQGNVSEDPLA